MPGPMRERALLYGALYRLGFQVVLYSIIECLVIPVVILLLLSDPPAVRSPDPARPAVLVVLLALPVFLALPFVREFLKSKDRRCWPRWRLALPASALTTAAAVVWLDLPFQFLPGAPRDRAWYVLASVLAGFPWLTLRLTGPIKPRWHHWRGKERGKPDVPHRVTEIACLDGLPISVALVSTLALSSVLGDIQVLILGGLQAVALTLSFLAKHERQLHGIYRNQNRWLDGHLDQVIALIEPPSAPVPVSATPNTGRDSWWHLLRRRLMG